MRTQSPTVRIIIDNNKNVRRSMRRMPATMRAILAGHLDWFSFGGDSNVKA